MATELGTAYVQILPSTAGLGKAIDMDVSGATEKAGKTGGIKLGGALKKALVGLGIGTVIKNVVSKGFEKVSAVAEYGDSIDKLSQKMGLTAEAYQEWDAVMQHSGTSMETMKSSMKTLANAAASGNEAFETIGLSMEEVGKMSQQDLFEATIAGLQNVEDTTQRTYLAGQLLGRGATELGALLNTSAEDTQAMRDRVHELGGVMSDDAVKAAAAFQDSLQDMTTAFGSVGRGLAAEFLPAVTSIMDGITALFTGDSGGLQQITDGILGIGTSIAEALPTLIESAGTIVGAIASAIGEHLPDIVAQGAEIIGNLLSGLAEHLPEIIGEIPNMMMQLGEAFLSYDWIGLGSDILSGIGEGIKNAVGNLIDVTKEAAGNLINGLKQRFGIASPSKVMAKEIGQWIPAGIAQGIEDNMGVVDQAMSDLAIGTMSFATEAYGGYESPYTNLDTKIDALTAAILNKDTTVVLEGSAAGIFKAVRKENQKFTKQTGGSGL